MSDLSSYYSLLFSTEITVFGIISAVILVFVQLIYSNYSYRQIWNVFKDPGIKLFFGLCALDLLMTAAAVYILLVYPTIIYLGPFSSIGVVTHPLYAFSCLLLIGVSILFFGVLIVTNIRHLQPHRAIHILARSLRYNDFRDFLWRRYPLEPPFNLLIGTVHLTWDDQENIETDEGRAVRLSTKSEANRRELDSIESEINSINQRVADAEDPLLPLRDMMIQFIKRSDLSSLAEASNVLSSTCKEFLGKIRSTTGEKWTPEGSLPMSLTKHLIGTLQTILEIADREGLDSAKKDILAVSVSYATYLFGCGRYLELEAILMFWQKVADESIGKSSSTFQLIIEYYGQICELIVDSLVESPASSREDTREDVLNRAFHKLGWLGERLLEKVPMESSSIMSNYEYSNEYDALLNFLLNASDKYDRQLPTHYPLAYFDALYVVLRKLIDVYKQRKDADLDEDLFRISYAFSSFAERAISARNAIGAALAVLRVWEVHEDLKKAKLDKQALDVVKPLVRIGILAAAYRNRLERVDFLSKPIHEWIAEKLVESGENYEDDIAREYIHVAVENSDGHENAWAYLKELGIRMSNNFGFAFDPVTGDDYPKDDPRRK